MRLLLFLFLTTWVSAEEMLVTRVACGSCYRPPKKSEGFSLKKKKTKPDIWPTIAADHPDLFLFMGDNVYADTTDLKKMRQTYRALTEHPPFAVFREFVPVLAVWDDHDYGKNDAGREFPQRVGAQAAFLDAFRFPADDPLRTQEGIYRQQTFGPEGKRLQIIILDTRYHRSGLIQKKIKGRKTYLPQTDPEATMLGKTQWAWLAEELKRPADLRFIVSSIQLLMTDHRFEKWANIPAERQRFLTLLGASPTVPTVLFSGDRHLAEVTKLESTDTGLPYPLYELTSSGMTHAGSGFYPSSLRVDGTHYQKDNYGLALIDWSRPKPKVTLEIKKATGGTVSATPVTF